MARAWKRVSLAVTLVLACAIGLFVAWSCSRQAKLGQPTAPLAGRRLRVEFIDVGHGDATLIVSPTGKTVLIDGGPKDKDGAVLALLNERGVCPLDLVLLTHRHADHVGGLPQVIEVCGARAYMDAPYPHANQSYAKLLSLLERRGMKVRQAERGRMVDLGDGAALTLLGPPEPPLRGTESDVNANSVVTRLDYGAVSFLLAADVEERGEGWLLEQRARVRATVLKVAHHGSRHSSSPAFLDAVSPRAAIISTEPGDSKHPHRDTLARLHTQGAVVFRTDRDGTVVTETDGRTVRLHGHDHVEQVEAP